MELITNFWVIESLYLNWFIIFTFLGFSFIFLYIRDLTYLNIKWWWLGISAFIGSIFTGYSLISGANFFDINIIILKILMFLGFLTIYEFLTTTHEVIKKIKMNKILKYFLFLLIILPLSILNKELFIKNFLIVSFPFLIWFAKTFHELSKTSKINDLKKIYNFMKYFFILSIFATLVLAIDTKSKYFWTVLLFSGSMFSTLFLIAVLLLIFVSVHRKFLDEKSFKFFKIFTNSLIVIFILVFSNFIFTFYFEDVYKEKIIQDTEEYSDFIFLQVYHQIQSSIKSVNNLRNIKSISNFMINRSSENKNLANEIIDILKENLDFDIIYIMDINGTVLISTNRDANDSFIGKNYKFRPYFIDAVSKGKGVYFAKGLTSNIYGSYYSSSIRDDFGKVIGVAVIKNNIDNYNGVFDNKEFDYFLFDKNKVIFKSSINFLNLKILDTLPNSKIEEIQNSKQFGNDKIENLNFIIKNNVFTYFDSSSQMGIKYTYAYFEKELDSNGFHVALLKNFNNIKDYKISLSYFLLVLNFLAILTFFIYLNYFFDKLNIEISEEKFKDLFENTDELIQSLDVKGNFLYVNSSWEKILGYNTTQLKNLNFFDILTKKSKREFIPIFEEMKTGKKFINVELDFMSASGKEISLIGNLKFKMINETPISSSDIFRDITNIKKVSKDIKRKNLELEKFQKFVVDREIKMIQLKRELENYKK